MSDQSSGGLPPEYGQPPQQPQYGQPEYGQAPPQPQWGGQPQWGAAPQWGGQPGWNSPAGQPPPGQGPHGYGPLPAGDLAWRPRPGIVPLRPLTALEILDGAFQSIRSNPRTMLGVSALLISIATLLNLLPQYFYFDTLGRITSANSDELNTDEVLGSVFSMFGGMSLTVLVNWLAATVLSGLLVVAVSEAVIGRRVAPGALWRQTSPRLLRLIGLTIVNGLAVLLAALVFGTVVVLLVFVLQDSTGAAIAIAVLGFLACMAFTVYAYVSLSLAAPALLLERLGIFASLARSWRLVRRSWWRVFGILLLAAIIAGIGSQVLALPGSQVAGLIIGGEADPGPGRILLATVITSLLSGIASTIITPFTAAVNCLLYIDRRMRAEGLDIELLRAASETPSGT